MVGEPITLASHPTLLGYSAGKCAAQVGRPYYSNGKNARPEPYYCPFFIELQVAYIIMGTTRNARQLFDLSIIFARVAKLYYEEGGPLE